MKDFTNFVTKAVKNISTFFKSSNPGALSPVSDDLLSALDELLVSTSCNKGSVLSSDFGNLGCVFLFHAFHFVSPGLLVGVHSLCQQREASDN
ncbi:hypothetical protein D3C79_693400 [compost metagenome]